jgi:hypothetical protein
MEHFDALLDIIREFDMSLYPLHASTRAVRWWLVLQSYFIYHVFFKMPCAFPFPTIIF